MEEVKKKHKKRSIYEVTPENDIKFHGPLSYRHFRIIGWASLIIAQIGVFLSADEGLASGLGHYGFLPTFLSFFGNLVAPLFLIAAFSVVLTAKNGYRKLITLYVGLSILMYIGFILVYQHYLVGLFTTLAPETGGNAAERLFVSIVGKGNNFFAFNIFIDLLLCSLITFFINYTPKEHFQGKKIIIFRLFALIPILYEVISILLKMLSSTGVIKLPPLVFPLLTTKAPIALLIFLMGALFFKFRERRFIKKGKTLEDYARFQETNLNKLHFSIFLSITIVIAVVIDLILLIVISASLASRGQIPVDMSESDFIALQVQSVYSWGFGQTFPLLFIIPLIMFFDYRKSHANALIDTIIPVVGVGLLVFVYVEGGFEVFRSFFGHIRNNNEENSSLSNSAKAIAGIIRKR